METRCCPITGWQNRKAPPSSLAAAYPYLAIGAMPVPMCSRPSGPAFLMMRAALQKKILGPVCHIAPFDDEQEVIARVNHSDYGLACTIWTGHLARAHRVAAQMEVGLVWVNTWYLRDLRTPFGGVKRSGLGREGGRHSLDFYSKIVNICIKL